VMLHMGESCYHVTHMDKTCRHNLRMVTCTWVVTSAKTERHTEERVFAHCGSTTISRWATVQSVIVS